MRTSFGDFDGARELKVSLLRARLNLRLSRGVEGRLLRQHEVHNAAQRPHVHRETVGLLRLCARNLRRYQMRQTDDFYFLFFLSCCPISSRNSVRTIISNGTDGRGQRRVGVE